MRNVARTWTYETACALGIEDTIDRNLPWHDYFEWFGPRFKLEVLPNNMDDHNTRDGYLDRVEYVISCPAWISTKSFFIEGILYWL